MPRGSMEQELLGPAHAAAASSLNDDKLRQTQRVATVVSIVALVLFCAWVTGGTEPHKASAGEGHNSSHHKQDPCAADHHADDGLAWWPFLLCSMLATVCVTAGLTKLSHGAFLGKSFNPPFTVVMYFFGYAMASFAQEGANAGVLSASVVAWKAAHPHVILFVLLPPLLFEDAASMDYYVFRKVLSASILLAGPGVAVSMFLTAGVSMALFGFAKECVVERDEVVGLDMVKGARENTISDDGRYLCDPQTNPSWRHELGPDGGLLCLECGDGSYEEPQLPLSVHLLLGGMLAATDPVAVCSVRPSPGPIPGRIACA